MLDFTQNLAGNVRGDKEERKAFPVDVKAPHPGLLTGYNHAGNPSRASWRAPFPLPYPKALFLSCERRTDARKAREADVVEGHTRQ